MKWLVVGFLICTGASIAAAQTDDRFALSQYEQRRCENALMNREASYQLLLGTSVAAICACQSRIIASRVRNEDVAATVAWLRAGKLPSEGYRQAEVTAAKRCLAIRLLQ